MSFTGMTGGISLIWSSACVGMRRASGWQNVGIHSSGFALFSTQKMWGAWNQRQYMAGVISPLSRHHSIGFIFLFLGCIYMLSLSK